MRQLQPSSRGRGTTAPASTPAPESMSSEASVTPPSVSTTPPSVSTTPPSVSTTPPSVQPAMGVLVQTCPDESQASPVQASPSSHSLSRLQHPVTAMWAHPPGSAHESAVHASASSQSRAVPATQAPEAQTSVPSHTVESAHEVPSVTSASTGQLTPEPVHVSAESQAPAAGRHDVDADA